MFLLIIYLPIFTLTHTHLFNISVNFVCYFVLYCNYRSRIFTIMHFCFTFYFNSSKVCMSLTDTCVESDTQERSDPTVTTEVQLFTKAYVHFCPICVRFYCLSDHQTLNNVCISIAYVFTTHFLTEYDSNHSSVL